MFDTDAGLIDDLGTTLSVFPEVLHPDSHLLNATGLQKRRGIDVAISTTIAAGTVILAANAALTFYDNIAAKIKAKSDENSCTLTYGTEWDNYTHEGYAYQATTTGSNCETTAIKETMQNAVKSCANKLHDAGSTLGCCRFEHGGTWTGWLRLSADPERYPATSATCPSGS